MIDYRILDKIKQELKKDFNTYTPFNEMAERDNREIRRRTK